MNCNTFPAIPLVLYENNCSLFNFFFFSPLGQRISFLDYETFVECSVSFFESQWMLNVRVIRSRLKMSVIYFIDCKITR